MLHAEVVDLPLEIEFTWDRVKHNILQSRKMEDKLLDLTNKYWYKSRKRSR